MSKYSYIKIKTPKSCRDCPFYGLVEDFEQGIGYTTTNKCLVGGRVAYSYENNKIGIVCPLKDWSKRNE